MKYYVPLSFTKIGIQLSEREPERVLRERRLPELHALFNIEASVERRGDAKSSAGENHKSGV